jgi:hypothetical protein
MSEWNMYTHMLNWHGALILQLKHDWYVVLEEEVDSDWYNLVGICWLKLWHAFWWLQLPFSYFALKSLGDGGVILYDATVLPLGRRYDLT